MGLQCKLSQQKLNCNVHGSRHHRPIHAPLCPQLRARYGEGPLWSCCMKEQVLLAFRVGYSFPVVPVVPAPPPAAAAVAEYRCSLQNTSLLCELGDCRNLSTVIQSYREKVRVQTLPKPNRGPTDPRRQRWSYHSPSLKLALTMSPKFRSPVVSSIIPAASNLPALHQSSHKTVFSCVSSKFL